MNIVKELGKIANFVKPVPLINVNILKLAINVDRTKNLLDEHTSTQNNYFKHKNIYPTVFFA